jgi:pimeloyl-ACP methyl ester carboxylesterase
MPAVASRLSIDRYPPEKAKFKAPLILVHGLWTGGWCWQAWATHLSNLGWHCSAVTFRGRGGQSDAQTLNDLTARDCVEDLADILSLSATPAVVLAHGLGALIALKAAEQAAFSALILAAPLPPANVKVDRSRAVKLLRLKYLPLVYLGRPFRIDDKDLRRFMLTPLAEIHQSKIARGIVPESSRLAAELLKPRMSVDAERINSPILVLAGAADQLVPLPVSREIARWLRADLEEYRDQGHWIIESDGERIVRDVHRWLIQKRGNELLLAEIP